MPFRFLPHDENANEHGEFVVAVPNWSVGDEFFTGDGRYRILKIVPFMEDDAEYNAMWMVKPTNKQ